MRDIRRRIWQTQPVSWLKRLFDSSVGPAVVAGSQSSRVLQTDPFKLPTVVAARQLIADTVSQFPLVALDAAGVQLDPVPAIVKRPNPAEPASDTFEKLTNALTRHGNAWLRVTLTGSNGYPLALEVVKNSRVTWELNSSGTSFARIEIDGIEQDRRLIQNVPFILESTPIGTSPLVEIRDVLVKLAAALDFSAQYYDQTAATPPYALISPTRLQADKATELLEAWTTARDENRPAVISGGLSLETFSPVSASDALMLEAIGQLDATIARVMQCPPSLLNTQAQSSLTYSTVRDEYRKFLLTLQASYLKRIEAAFTQYLPRGVTAQFETSSLTQLDQSEQLAFDADAIAAGILTIDEVRARRGLLPTPEEITTDV